MPWLILPLACWKEPAGGHRNVGNPLWWWSCGWNNTSANVCKLKYCMSGSEITLGIAYYCFHYLYLVCFIVCMVVSLGEKKQLTKVFVCYDGFLQFDVMGFYSVCSLWLVLFFTAFDCYEEVLQFLWQDFTILVCLVRRLLHLMMTSPRWLVGRVWVTEGLEELGLEGIVSLLVSTSCINNKWH